jgi:hypothetical protein
VPKPEPVRKPDKPVVPCVADYVICEAFHGDECFHVMRAVNTKTHCGKKARELPGAFRQGAEALRVLKDDSCAVCPVCVNLLHAMFGERN